MKDLLKQNRPTVGDYNPFDASKLIHRADVHKSFGGLDHLINWCKENTTREWRCQVEKFPSQDNQGHYVFWFEDSRDHFAFSLKFG